MLQHACGGARRCNLPCFDNKQSMLQIERKAADRRCGHEARGQATAGI